MNILIAPCAFKGSLSAGEAARAIAAGLHSANSNIETQECPLADGGEGTLAILLRALGGQEFTATVLDPLGRKIRARCGLLDAGRTALIEIAQAVGLTLLEPGERDPLQASSYGVGQPIQAALDQGARQIWIGLGGSATVDGGAGMLQALGARLLDARGEDIPRGGMALAQLARLELDGLDPRLQDAELLVLCDVLSPLLGPRGARLYMPQKGADPDMCDRLERNLERLAEVAQKATEVDLRRLRGAGAAGGLGIALALLGGKLLSGSRFIIERLRVAEQAKGCDLLIGGEGHLDEQTLEGKAIWALARLAKAHNKPLIVLCGARLGALARLHETGMTAAFSIAAGPISEKAALQQTAQALEATAAQLARLIGALTEK